MDKQPILSLQTVDGWETFAVLTLNILELPSLMNL